MRVSLVLLLVAANMAAGQTVTVRGIAYDSILNRPLPGAFISIAGTRRATMSDAAGRFGFDSIAPGDYSFVLQHDALDSIGMTDVRKRVSARGFADEVVLGLPAFDTFWRMACGGVPPRDSGLVFGTVRDASGRSAVERAAVDVSWLDLSVDQKKVSQHRRSGKVTTDSSGAYALCGVPPNTGIELRATRDSMSSGVLHVLPGTWRVFRRDIRMGMASVNGNGTIVGVVTSQGQPYANARVVADGMPEARTTEDGRFVLRNVPAGTRQLEITAVGMSPGLVNVDVTPGDTARIEHELGRIVELPSVKVSAPTVRTRLVREYEERRKLASGYFVDSTKIARHLTLGSVIEEIPGTYVKMRGTRIQSIALRGCAANIILDGKQVEQAELTFLDAPDIAAIEIYPSGFNTPLEITARVRNAGTCGAVVIWTKQFIAP